MVKGERRLLDMRRETFVKNTVIVKFNVSILHPIENHQEDPSLATFGNKYSVVHVLMSKGEKGCQK